MNDTTLRFNRLTSVEKNWGREIDSNRLIVDTCEGIMFVRFIGIQDQCVANQYFDISSRFILAQSGRSWKKLIDLSAWELTLPEVSFLMSKQLNKEIASGLEFEAIVMPKIHLSRWQIENTIKVTNNANLFHFAEDIESAIQMFPGIDFPID